ncbi:TenA family transcriptional regulator [Agarilytica rhodophyticola]|uniref:TenA family transcriptional regulator n=1 Tax=Agarilytica rhodophyticola TaxID=1737490 RepID=UPI000B346CAC|nr:iron-containing redox enzyme family protein [Agarilytica rhodophyticola]
MSYNDNSQSKNLSFIPNDNVSLRYESRIRELANTVFIHQALKNSFYELWVSRPFTEIEFRKFSHNYFYRVHATTRRLSVALVSIDDWNSKIQLLHNLSDELGAGFSENVHVRVLHRWINSLGRKIDSSWRFDAIDESMILDTTKEFIAETESLCQKGALSACGAILAQEWHGYTQIGLLYEGFRNYKPLYEFDDFHDVSEYFYVHLGRAEKEHKEQAVTMCARNCNSESDFLEMSDSFQRYLQLLAKFWDGIHLSITDNQVRST